MFKVPPSPSLYEGFGCQDLTRFNHTESKT